MTPHRKTAALCSLALLPALAGQALAQASAAPVPRPSVSGSETIKHLPASRDELVFRGENVSRSWTSYLTRGEAARITTFQLGLLSTISLLPERSMIKVVINGRTLVNTQIRSADQMSMIPVRIPTGVLVPGYNAVQVNVTAAHRVDCTVKATYELWSALDPTQTGFVVPALIGASPRSLDDLAAEPLSPDGTTPIHLRLPAEADENTLNRAVNLVSALVVRSHLMRPVVDVGPEAGNGAGFDVVIGSAPSGDATGAVGARQDNLALSRDPTTNRLTVAFADGVDFDAVTAGLRQGALAKTFGTTQGLALYQQASGAIADDNQRIAFSDLGLPTENFTGRRYAEKIGLNLPADFFAGNYGKARIYLDGSHSSGLDKGSDLVFRVNGTLVSSLPLSEGASDHFDHEQVELPLQFFRPGYNEVGLEATTLTAADEQCEPSTSPSPTRLSVAGTSELELPAYARMTTLPQIPAALQTNNDGIGQPLDLYILDQHATSLGAAATFAANVTAQTRRQGTIRVHLDPPTALDPPGIVVGTLDALPDNLARPTHAVIAIQDETQAAAIQPSVDPAVAAAPDAESADARRTVVSSDVAFKPGPWRRVGRAYETGRQWLRQNGFFFSSLGAHGETLPVSASALLVASVGGSEAAPKVGGIEVPVFTTKPDNWVVVTAKSDAVLADGLTRLVSTGRWKNLTGEAVSLDLADNQLHSIQPSRLTYVMSRNLALSDVRPILGGIMSSNILISATVLVALLTLLGVSTHLVLRKTGAGQE